MFRRVRLAQLSCTIQPFTSFAPYGDVHSSLVDSGPKLVLQETPPSSARKNTVPSFLDHSTFYARNPKRDQNDKDLDQNSRNGNRQVHIHYCHWEHPRPLRLGRRQHGGLKYAVTRLIL